MNFDDNALFRHKDIQEMRDEDEEEPAELEAARHERTTSSSTATSAAWSTDGLAMGTMDIIKLHGGDPANFLDVGGGATKERVTTAFKLICRTTTWRARSTSSAVPCDATSSPTALSPPPAKSASTFRSSFAWSTNVEQSKKILEKSGLPIVSADDLADAAEKVVEAVKEAA